MVLVSGSVIGLVAKKGKIDSHKDIYIAIGVGLLVAFLASMYWLSVPDESWSKDKAALADGMKMLVQFQTEPSQPTVGPLTVMARIKDDTGYTTEVGRLVFRWLEPSQGFNGEKEGVPKGPFGTRGYGFYSAGIAVPHAGDWQVEVLFTHAGLALGATFPMVVKADP